MKRCCRCKVTKELSSFTRNKNEKDGLQPQCKACRKLYRSTDAYRRQRLDTRLLPEKWPAQLWRIAKQRAKKLGVEFSIEVSDVIVPERCPVFGGILQRGTIKHHRNSPSTDRIDPKLGYIKGNISVISHRANILKNDASSAELRLVADYVDRVSNVA